MSHCHYSAQGLLACERPINDANSVEHFVDRCGLKPGGADYISGIYTKRKLPGEEAETSANIRFFYYPDKSIGTINYDKEFTCTYDKKTDKTKLYVPHYDLSGIIENKKGITWENKVNYSGRDSGMCKKDIISGTYKGSTAWGGEEIHPVSVKVQYDAKKGTGVYSTIDHNYPFACVGNKLIFDEDGVGVFDNDNIYFPHQTITNKVQE